MKYICTRDFQGNNFAVGKIQTANQWKETAMAWCWQDDCEELMKKIEEMTDERKIIDIIQEIWQLEIVLINDKTAELIKEIQELKDNLKKYENNEILNAFNNGKYYTYNEIIEIIINRGGI